MHPDKNMKRVVNGQRYNVATATLLASDEYWDGNNFERHGRNTFLYKTRGGAFFVVKLSMWQGEKDSIEPISRHEAVSLYEELPEHNIEYEEAFDAVIEEAIGGRPTYYGQAMKQTTIWLPEEMLAWLKSTPSMSETIRDLIKQAMNN